ncbi:helix-hairpin-helix domain-containing protein, partial [Neisseria blantyrii]|uniref:helix-hairpin-helix domain-containing protein n=2 Tax=Neisseriaceae TaxID=481 RepID=UPI00387E4594
MADVSVRQFHFVRRCRFVLLFPYFGGNLMKKIFMLLYMLFSCAFSLAAVNINAASPQELEALPGIGPAKAKAIAEYRAQNGAFKSVDELTKVKGIGPAVLAKLKDQASVGAPAPKAPAKPA